MLALVVFAAVTQVSGMSNLQNEETAGTISTSNSQIQHVFQGIGNTSVSYAFLLLSSSAVRSYRPHFEERDPI